MAEIVDRGRARMIRHCRGFASLLLLVFCGVAAPMGVHAEVSVQIRNEAEFAEYRQALVQEIFWRMQRARYFSRNGGRVVVSFKIQRSGRIAKSNLVSSSGDPHVDRAAMMLLQPGALILPIPDSAKMEFLDITVPLRFSPQ